MTRQSRVSRSGLRRSEERKPDSDSSEGETCSQEAEHGHVETNTDIATSAGQQVEEEALVKPLQQIVQTPECSLNDSAQHMEVSLRSLLHPGGHSLQCDGLDTEPVRQTMVTTGYSSSL